MSLLVLGLSHHGAPMELLESAVLDQAARARLEATIVSSEHVVESIVVSTCNRTEVYAEGLTFHGALTDVSDALAAATGVDLADLQPHLYVHYEDRGIAHAFSVAAGLDSMAVGEAQILGQLRDSLTRAQRRGHVGPALNTLLQQSLRVGKRVHTETEIDDVSRSLVGAGLSAAMEVLGPISDARVLVLGAGGMGALAAVTASQAGAASVTIANRGLARAERLAGRVGGVALPWDGRFLALSDADIIISSTGATGVVLTVGPRCSSTWRCHTTSTWPWATSREPPASVWASWARCSAMPVTSRRCARRATSSRPRSLPTSRSAQPKPSRPPSPRCARGRRRSSTAR